MLRESHPPTSTRHAIARAHRKKRRAVGNGRAAAPPPRLGRVHARAPPPSAGGGLRRVEPSRHRRVKPVTFRPRESAVLVETVRRSSPRVPVRRAVVEASVPLHFLAEWPKQHQAHRDKTSHPLPCPTECMRWRSVHVCSPRHACRSSLSGVGANDVWREADPRRD